MAISDLFEAGRLGLIAHRKAMQTTSQNITNANTPHYSRQKLNLQATPPVLSPIGDRIGGGGVEVKSVMRMHDAYLQKQIFDQSKHLGDYRMRSESLKRIESILTSGATDLTGRMTKFFNDMKELSLNPEISTHRFSVKESAKSLASGFREVSDTIDGIQRDITMRMQKAVDDVNRFATELAGLNQEIAKFTIRGEVPNELLDRQDLLVEQITEKIGYQVDRQPSGAVNLIIPGAGILVNQGEATHLKVRQEPGSGVFDYSKVGVFLQDMVTHKMIPAKRIPSGELGGLMHVRDNVVMPTLSSLDEIAFEMSKAINAAHSQGSGLDGVQGRNFFEDLERVNGAAGNFRVEADIEKSGDAIAVGFDGFRSGDNRIALEMSKVGDLRLVRSIDDEGLDASRNYTLHESVNSLVTNVAVEAQAETQRAEHQGAIMEQLQNHRKSVSGVSLEEEAVAMMQHQAAFNAAAKTMRFGDEMLETILSIVD